MKVEGEYTADPHRIVQHLKEQRDTIFSIPEARVEQATAD